jgi:hypothetical protein
MSLTRRLALWTYTMASVTYLNIAVKVVYWLLFEDVFHGPELMTWAGFVYWTIVSVNIVLLLTRQLQCLCWAISFVSARLMSLLNYRSLAQRSHRCKPFKLSLAPLSFSSFPTRFPPSCNSRLTSRRTRQSRTGSTARTRAPTGSTIGPSGHAGDGDYSPGASLSRVSTSCTCWRAWQHVPSGFGAR